MLLLGIDIGTSSVKVSVVDAHSGHCIGSAQYPETEAGILSLHPGWAEQSPQQWWEHVQLAIAKLHAQDIYNSFDISAIGIAYQMHGLVMIDEAGEPVRHSIIWCDSRAVETGDRAFDAIGREKCLRQLLNSPGNFTASKLAWVKNQEPAHYAHTKKIMLPGDYIAFRLTGTATTSISALSEGVFWDFQQHELSTDIFGYYGLDRELMPPVKDVFGLHGELKKEVAAALSLQPGIPVTYKAGDQPNNALSLNVLEPGEVAASAGTSGVIYAVSDQLTSDPASRVNTFAHVNYTRDTKRLGVLLCINGTGICNKWVKELTGGRYSYSEMNKAAATIDPGSEGLLVFPFGNGAERMLGNRRPGAHLSAIDLNKHQPAHLFRATQEGIAFAFRYGLDIMRENELHPKVIRAGKANMFLSDVFTGSFVNTLNVPLEMYHCDGSVGAALGAGIGAGIFSSPKEAFRHFRLLSLTEPTQHKLYNELYHRWLEQLNRQLN